MIRTLTLVILLFLGGCAASAPDVTPSEPEAPSEDAALGKAPAARVLLETDLVTAGVEGDVARGLESPSGTLVALHVVSRDGAAIALADRSTGLVDVVYDAGGLSELSMAFSPDGALLFVGERAASGGGVFEIDTATGTLRSVGCSASDVVLGVRTDGPVAVRDENNLYMVDAANCATLETFDVRRMTEIAISPAGDHLAYVHRELSYNRESRAYEPDTTLHVVPTMGGEPIRVVGDKYAPRRISWLSGGSELAYDVVVQNGSGNRGLSIWSAESGQSTWVIPPGRLTGSATHGQYGPDPGTFLFQLDGVWHYRTGVGSFVQPLSLSFMPEQIVWVDARTIWARRGDISAFLELVEGAAPQETPGAVWAWTTQ